MLSRISSLIQSTFPPKTPLCEPDQLIDQARKGHATTTDELLRLGANPHYASRKHAGATALMLAAQSGHHEVVALLAVASQPNATDDKGFTALMHAAIGGNMHSVSLLLNHDDPNLVDREHQFSALMWACFNSRSVAAHLRIECSDARIHAPRSDQLNTPSTALMLAAANGRADLAYGLLTRSDPRHQTSNGSTPSSFARQAGKRQLADRIDALSIALSEHDELTLMNSNGLNHDSKSAPPFCTTDCIEHPPMPPMRGSLRI